MNEEMNQTQEAKHGILKDSTSDIFGLSTMMAIAHLTMSQQQQCEAAVHNLCVNDEDEISQRQAGALAAFLELLNIMPTSDALVTFLNYARTRVGLEVIALGESALDELRKAHPYITDRGQLHGMMFYERQNAETLTRLVDLIPLRDSLNERIRHALATGQLPKIIDEVDAEPLLLALLDHIYPSNSKTVDGKMSWILDTIRNQPDEAPRIAARIAKYLAIRDEQPAAPTADEQNRMDSEAYDLMDWLINFLLPEEPKGGIKKQWKAVYTTYSDGKPYEFAYLLQRLRDLKAAMASFTPDAGEPNRSEADAEAAPPAAIEFGQESYQPEDEIEAKLVELLRWSQFAELDARIDEILSLYKATRDGKESN